MSKHLNEEYLQNLLGLLRGFTPHTPITGDDIENLKKAVPSQFVRTILKSMYDNYEKVVNAQLSKVKSQFDYLLKGLER